ncbi:MAG: hypothetical protein KGQ70_01170 [Alphaproteobacteria bacterium]|nr:hypothetical protein [Alphaproteobacteria bacterium]
MLMLCWFYCIPFAKGLFFASGPMAFVLALFVLKRGVRQQRAGLRQLAFLLMFAALLKMALADVYFLRIDLLCAFNQCHDGGFFRAAQAAGLAALVLGSFLLLFVYRGFARDRRQKPVTPEQVHLSFWANFGLVLVLVLLCWLAAPWAGYLTVGHIPAFFMRVPWQRLAMLDVAVLLVGFWKLEDCHDPEERKKGNYRMNVWTAKDTLWVSVVLLLIGLALSYVSNDVLSMAMPRESQRLHINLDGIDFGHFGPGFQQPDQTGPLQQQ